MRDQVKYEEAAGGVLQCGLGSLAESFIPKERGHSAVGASLGSSTPSSSALRLDSDGSSGAERSKEKSSFSRDKSKNTENSFHSWLLFILSLKKS